MFSAFQTFGRLGAGARAVSWSPLALWPDGAATPGMWISPRTLASSFADSTGTTPVAAPGTVADTSNPVGLALDIRAGAPEVLGPELVTNGGPFTVTTGWTAASSTLAVVSGSLQVTSNPGAYGAARSTITTVAGATYQLNFASAGGSVAVNAWIGTTAGGNGLAAYLVPIGETKTAYFTATGTTTHLQIVNNSNVGANTTLTSLYSVREVPGNHMLQSTSAARPLLSAYDGQTLGPGDTYDVTGFPIAQLYDGVDDGMATAAFSAGTLTAGMDCMIAVRRDSAGACVAGLYNGIADATKFFGMAESGSGSGCVGSGAGTPTVWVDGTQLAGGTAVTRGTLHTALTVGDVHIIEFRGLDLSTWASSGFGLYTGYLLPGARGDILLYPSTASTADKDKARQWLANYYGVTLA